MKVERTCVVCRSVSDKSEMLRFVYGSSDACAGLRQLEFDLGDVLPGRGAYCHLSKECLLARDTLVRLEMSLLGNSGITRREFAKAYKGLDRQELDGRLSSMLVRAGARYRFSDMRAVESCQCSEGGMLAAEALRGVVVKAAYRKYVAVCKLMEGTVGVPRDEPCLSSRKKGGKLRGKKGAVLPRGSGKVGIL